MAANDAPAADAKERAKAQAKARAKALSAKARHAQAVSPEGPAFSWKYFRRLPLYRAYLFGANLLVSVFGCWYVVSVIDRPWFTVFSPYCYSVWYVCALLACASDPRRAHTKWLIRNLVYHGAAWAVVTFALWPKSAGSSLIPVCVALAHMIHYSGVMSTVFIQGLPGHLSEEPPKGVHAQSCCAVWARCWWCYCTPRISLSRLSRHRLFFLLRATMARIDLFTDISFGLVLVSDSGNSVLFWMGIVLFALCFIDYFAVDLSITAAKLTERLLNFKFFSQVLTEVPVFATTIIISFLRDGSQDDFVVGIVSCAVTLLTLVVHLNTYVAAKRRMALEAMHARRGSRGPPGSRRKRGDLEAQHTAGGDVELGDRAFAPPPFVRIESMDLHQVILAYAEREISEEEEEEDQEEG